MKQRSRFGIWANPDTKGAVGSYIFPERIAAILFDGPMLEVSACGFVFFTDGGGWAVCGAFFADATEMTDMVIFTFSIGQFQFGGYH